MSCRTFALCLIVASASCESTRCLAKDNILLQNAVTKNRLAGSKANGAWLFGWFSKSDESTEELQTKAIKKATGGLQGERLDPRDGVVRNYEGFAALRDHMDVGDVIKEWFSSLEPPDADDPLSESENNTGSHYSAEEPWLDEDGDAWSDNESANDTQGTFHVSNSSDITDMDSLEFSPSSIPISENSTGATNHSVDGVNFTDLPGNPAEMADVLGVNVSDLNTSAGLTNSTSYVNTSSYIADISTGVTNHSIDGVNFTDLPGNPLEMADVLGINVSDFNESASHTKSTSYGNTSSDITDKSTGVTNHSMHGVNDTDVSGNPADLADDSGPIDTESAKGTDEELEVFKQRLDGISWWR